jgi:hypothetical protein
MTASRERSRLCTVEVNVDPDSGGDAVGAAAGLDVSLLQCGSESLAFAG